MMLLNYLPKKDKKTNTGSVLPRIEHSSFYNATGLTPADIFRDVTTLTSSNELRAIPRKLLNQGYIYLAKLNRYRAL